ncbi:DUF924 family protein [Psychrobacter sp. I-STPA10]|uniref:DUF924 family protein n=1 Tax=Psychrobacter sp. I-STPA10 TaxID=2585769 RepID=UPI001E4B0186|nr:DUF924 family protein [Psychrobacter sp. I-STPA10]
MSSSSTQASTTTTPQSVLTFWFDTLNPADWFKKSNELDQQINNKFANTLQQAGRGELVHWRENVQGRLAEIIVLDQFSRNIHRDSAEAFKHDGMALILSQELVAHPDFATLSQDERNFALLPMMHSESKQIHLLARPLFEQFASRPTINFEQKHFDIIERFGRYPHRNAILNRTSTNEEIEFLQGPNSGF